MARHNIDRIFTILIVPDRLKCCENETGSFEKRFGEEPFFQKGFPR